MLLSDGVIIILSYPDTVVRPAYWERFSGFWKKIGIGSEHAVQAGHAGLLLIQKNTPEVHYFDFGRYITSYGNGRVRSKQTDPEIAIPILAQFKEDNLTNLTEILLWLEKYPEKTHGDGRLVASINTQINFAKAKEFIDNLIAEKEIPYGAFLKKGTNCARFVTDTLIYACANKKIQLKLKSSNYLTPSPIGNVIKASSNNKIYTIYNQKIAEYKNRSILKEYKATFFNKFDTNLDLKGTEKPNSAVFNLKHATWLGGIGSGAWFKIEEKKNTNTYKIARYTAGGKKDFEGLFIQNDVTFNYQKKYQFVHPTNCQEVFIQQNESIFHLYFIPY